VDRDASSETGGHSDDSSDSGCKVISRGPETSTSSQEEVIIVIAQLLLFIETTVKLRVINGIHSKFKNLRELKNVRSSNETCIQALHKEKCFDCPKSDFVWNHIPVEEPIGFLAHKNNILAGMGMCVFKISGCWIVKSSVCKVYSTDFNNFCQFSRITSPWRSVRPPLPSCYPSLPNGCWLLLFLNTFS